MVNLSILVDNVKSLSKQRGVTMTHLCKVLGKRATFLADVRLGKDKLSEEQIETIATTLNTTPGYLRGETDDPTPADSGSEEWMDEIKISPHKLAAAKTIAAMSDEGAAIINGMSKLSVEDLLKVEKIIDMIKGE